MLQGIAVSIYPVDTHVIQPPNSLGVMTNDSVNQNNLI